MPTANTYPHGRCSRTSDHGPHTWDDSGETKYCEGVYTRPPRGW